MVVYNQEMFMVPGTARHRPLYSPQKDITGLIVELLTDHQLRTSNKAQLKPIQKTS